MSATHHDLPPKLRLLRQNPTWAALSHFVRTFQPAINIDTISISDIEEDLLGSASITVPRLIHRLLYILTYDRKITTDNFAHYLLKQYAKRMPHLPNPLGTEDAPIKWSELDMIQRLELTFTLCEWQFTGTARLRSMMNEEDELFWRLEPIGYDAKRNTYWLIGGDRLWVQRANPNLLKHKPKTPKRAAKGKGKPPASKPPASRPQTNGTSQRATRSRAKPAPSAPPARSTRGSKRAAPEAQEPSSNKRQRPSTTRTSTRLRRGEREEEVWQEIPEEWLNDTSDAVPGPSNASAGSTPSAKPADALQAIFGDDESDLTELSSDEVQEAQDESADEGQDEDDDSESEAEDNVEENSSPSPDPNFVEWETVCVTIEDWQTFPSQFEGSTSVKEKALYKVLKSYAEVVCEQLREAVRKVQVVEVQQTRKRSSRLAVINQDKEAIAAARAKQLEIEETNQRETRRIKREEEKIKRELQRELRAKEREERFLDGDKKEHSPSSENPGASNDGTSDDNTGMDSHVDIVGNGGSSRYGRTLRKPATHAEPNGGSSRKLVSPSGDDWELDCEVCLQRGVNIDDGREITCCEKCGKWQHVDCHNQADARAGLPPRDWSSVDFVCKNCIRKDKRNLAARTRRLGKTTDGMDHSSPSSSPLPYHAQNAPYPTPVYSTPSQGRIMPSQVTPMRWTNNTGQTTPVHTPQSGHAGPSSQYRASQMSQYQKPPAPYAASFSPHNPRPPQPQYHPSMGYPANTGTPPNPNPAYHQAYPSGTPQPYQPPYAAHHQPATSTQQPHPHQYPMPTLHPQYQYPHNGQPIAPSMSPGARPSQPIQAYPHAQARYNGVPGGMGRSYIMHEAYQTPPAPSSLATYQQHGGHIPNDPRIRPIGMPISSAAGYHQANPGMSTSTPSAHGAYHTGHPS